MAQKVSTPALKNVISQGTRSLIRDAFANTTSKRIILNPLFLEDEKLPEAERVAVLNEVFNRNIRVKQLERLARYMSPVLGGEIPTNLLIYGPTGTGKSVTCIHFLSNLAAMCEESKIGFRYAYVDLTTPRTCFGALNQLALALDGTTRRYKKGIAMDYMQEAIICALSQTSDLVCIVLDEADNVTENNDLLFMFLAKTLPRRIRAKLVYIFLSNKLEWDKSLDPRILSVLKKTDLIFEPYDALDLVEILNLRVEKALDKSKVDPGAIRKIAAYASRETGDARKAVELLAKAVKIAEEKTGYLGEAEVDEAERVLEIDKTEMLVLSLASQQKLALMACHAAFAGQKRKISTGHAYSVYCEMCNRQGYRALTQRRFSDMISLLDLYGLINARVVSKGRFGKTRELSGSLPAEVVRKLMRDGAR